MKLIIRGKKETLDIEDFEFRKEFDFGFFLFEFLAYDFNTFTPASGDGLTDVFMTDSEAQDILLYLVNAGNTPGALVAVQNVFRFACEFCLDMDYAEYQLNGLSARQRWYVLSKSGEHTELRAFTEQLAGFSEYTSIVRPGELFYSDSLLHSDSGEIEMYMEESTDIAALVEKYRNTELETLKVYETDSLFGLLYAEFWALVTANARIRKCGFCGKHFVPFSEASEYCARMVQGKGKPCKDYAPMVIHRQKIQRDELLSIYKKAEAARYMRNKRNPAVHTLDQFDKWRESAKRAFEQAKNGELSAEELKKAISGG